MNSIKSLILCFLLFFSALAGAVSGPALIINSNYSDVDVTLSNKLTSVGYTVTRANSIPSGSLATYKQIWDLRYNTALISDEEVQYSTYLVSGGSLFFMGENPNCCITRFNSIKNFVASVGGGTLGTLGSVNGVSQVQPPFNTNLATVSFAGGGALPSNGLGTGAPITVDNSRGSAGVIWGPGTLASATSGTMISVFDVDFLTTANLRSQFADNLIEYLAAPTVVVTNAVPVASNVNISVLAETGAVLTGAYTYSDVDSDQENSGGAVFRWISHNINTSAVGGVNVGTSRFYTPLSSDVGKYLYFCVSPAAAAGASPGNEVCSVATVAVIPGPVNGSCGRAANLASYGIPSANLCIAGTSSQVVSSQGLYSWTCDGTNGGTNASCTAPWASNAGSGTGSLSASGNNWTVTSATFSASTSSSAPAGVTFPNGILDIQLSTSGNSGTDATVTVQYSTAVPAGAVYMKYGKTQSNQTDHWYELPANRAVFAQDRMSVTLTLTDGGVGDNDMTANGTIVDPGGPALVPPPAPIPTLSEWAMIFMASLMAMFGIRRMRRNK